MHVRTRGAALQAAQHGGGVRVDGKARVLDTGGDPIPGLYAAGEVVGMYYGTYTGATSVLKGLVFGKIAGADAASSRRNL